MLGLMPANIFTTYVLPAVSALDWQRCPWCDDTSSNKRIFPGAAPRAGGDAWKKRLTVTEKSMAVMFQYQVEKHIKLWQHCTFPKLANTEMDEYAEQAAFVVSMVDEVQAMVPIPDDTMQDMLVRPCIENGPQMRVDICSVLLTRADGFAPRIWVCSRR